MSSGREGGEDRGREKTSKRRGRKTEQRKSSSSSSWSPRPALRHSDFNLTRRPRHSSPHPVATHRRSPSRGPPHHTRSSKRPDSSHKHSNSSKQGDPQHRRPDSSRRTSQSPDRRARRDAKASGEDPSRQHRSERRQSLRREPRPASYMEDCECDACQELNILIVAREAELAGMEVLKMGLAEEVEPRKAELEGLDSLLQDLQKHTALAREAESAFEEETSSEGALLAKAQEDLAQLRAEETRLENLILGYQ